MESQNNPSKDPVVLWLTGGLFFVLILHFSCVTPSFLSGPGCSSELAVLFENGPWNVNSDLTLSNNPYSWNTNATMIYVDQPAGTGFSYVGNPKGYVTNELRMADELYTLIQG